ncbi:FecCD family ABC transporter permease [Lysinibacter cavernae]|uniref:Iron complex transport system permease protein n=1 Tax=Lysinibacter cavernae TaxID=1640652 RepID=A0A7X5TSF7_9MICO|nr:iron chelate uptake ABC transporter family permease subunit [Lysinibacter cavernae]NIH52945.1 iron complex transport system permease protein [Lysinibacter cavernae]
MSTTQTLATAEAIRSLRVSRRRRETIISLILVALLLVVAAVTLSTGAYRISPDAVLPTLFGNGATADSFAIFQLRLPRLTIGVLAGIAFAVSGALFQSLLGNPLASPDIMGITGGASVAAVFATLILGLSGALVSIWAFAGAMVIATAISLLSRDQQSTGYRFVLTGVGFAFMCTGALGYLLTRAEAREAQAALVWTVGSIANVRWPDIAVFAVALLVLIPAVAVSVRRIRVLQLGHEMASGLGVRVTRARIIMLILAVSLAACATAAVGPIAFVALCSAPIARRLVATGSLALVPTALVGALIILTSDLIAQNAFANATVPIGIVTGAVGAPYLLWLLATAHKGQSS